MHLLSLETASPPARYTQRDCYRIFSESKARHRLRERSVELMEKVLLGDTGIDTRGFCYPEVETIFDAGPEELNRIFEREAPRLGTRALHSALDSAGLQAGQLDGLVVCTCTGYLCPGLSSFIAQQARLRDDCELIDLVGMGCGAAVPSLRMVSHQLLARPERHIAMIAVEVCSAAFYLDDDPGVIISACLFGDGAAASLWTGTPGDSPHWRADGFESLHWPEKRQFLRFENARGFLRNRLSKRVPAEASAAVRTLFDRSLANGLDPQATILSHTGGRDVLDALEEALPGHTFPESREILRLHGNMSSPSILFVLKEHLARNGNSAGPLWLTSFGAGFCAYSFSLSTQGTTGVPPVDQG